VRLPTVKQGDLVLVDGPRAKGAAGSVREYHAEVVKREGPTLTVRPLTTAAGFGDVRVSSQLILAVWQRYRPRYKS
jgi:hypothetical protein